MEGNFQNFLRWIFDALNHSFFTFGNAKITLLNIFYLGVLTFLLFYFSNKLKNSLIKKILDHTHLSLPAQLAVGTITRYLIIVLGFLMILQIVGIDITALSVLAGAVGIGVGFGLQNVTSNFISGLIILIERPIKVGDRIVVAGIDGEVLSIGARSTVIRTNDDIAIIVPNSKFISEEVTNWSFDNNAVRFRIPVGVAYDTDLNLAKKVLIEVGNENEDVVKEPPPSVRLINFGDSAINLELRIWSKSRLQRKGYLISNLNFAIWEKFGANNIEMPFPQRDLHLRSGQLSINNGEVSIRENEEDDEKK